MWSYDSYKVEKQVANITIWLSTFSTAFTYSFSQCPDLISHHFVSMSLIDQVSGFSSSSVGQPHFRMVPYMCLLYSI